MIYSARAPIALRGIALVVAVSIAATGSGLPMCVSLLAQAAAPCDMHSGHNGATHRHAAQHAALVAQATGQACHQDATGIGCAAGSTCPTGGPAAGVRTPVSVDLRAAASAGVLAPRGTFASYLAPPPSPPPQA